MENKTELLNTLKASRDWNTNGNTPNWRRAFAAFNAANGTKLSDYGCSKCFEKVKEWLQRD